MTVGPSTNTLAISRVPAPISTSAPIMQNGPTSADSETRADASTIAVGWIGMPALDRCRFFGPIGELAHDVRLGDNYAIDGRDAAHFGHGRLALENLHLHAKLIA